MTPSYDAQRNEFCAYVLPERETPFGMTLGNFKTFASCTPKGGIRGLWDADSDRIIFGTHQIGYRLRDRGRTILPHRIEREFTFLPYAQISEFALDDRLLVTECFYVPHGPAHDRTVAFVVDVALHNSSAESVDAAIFAWALLVGQRFYGEPETEVHAARDDGAICAWNEETGAARFWGGSRKPTASAIGLREQALLRAMREGTLREEGVFDEVTPELAEIVRGRIYGGLEFRLTIAPGARETLRIVVAYDGRGRDAARARYDRLQADPRALHDTQAYYGTALADARFMTPSPVVNRGVVWAKANMLRIVKEYPLGWGSTNSPPSDILVSRDTSWFVHGFDYFMPRFSRDALDLFNRYVGESGQVVEYVRGVSGYNTSYDLNINDDTPLHLVAMLHHYNATLDDAWVRELAPLVVRIADYLLSQRDANGLVFCNAKGVDMYGIASWRNIIPYYTLDGAVTEINAEAVFALVAASALCRVAGDDANAARFAREGEALRAKMMALLFNDDTSAFVLNYDKDGNYQDNFTADEVFPVLFGVADAGHRREILARLSESDFVTPVGLRTISTADAWYFPSHGFGLLGGVWPDLTLWFTVALARNGFVDASADWLEKIYATMEAGTATNAVPGQFAEWFDGGSLTNRGMYMSPWTGAKYLWAVAETVGGFDGYRTRGGLHLAPLLPERWAWVAGVRVHFGGERCTYVVDARTHTIVGNVREATAEEPYRYRYEGTDVSAEVTVAPIEVAVVAFEDAAGAVRGYLCNTSDSAREVAIEFRGATLRRAVAPGALLAIDLVKKRAGRVGARA